VKPRVPRLLPFPALAGLTAVVVGAAAAHDPALKPRFDLLALFTLYAMAVILMAARADQRFRAPRASARARGGWIELAALSLVAGAFLVWERGWLGFWIVAGLALLSAAFVSGPRLTDTNLGGAVAVFSLGPLLSAGAAMAIVGEVTPTALWIGLPVGLVADAARRARETAALPAGSAAPPWFAADLVGAYGAVLVSVLAGVLPWITLLALLTLPWAAMEFAQARRGVYPWPEAARRMRRLHFLFGAVLAVSVFAARVMATRLS
jgi:1,4-dihydroxy-2-naphthoate octaprenyltransferase